MYISYTKYILFVVVISQPHVGPRLLIFPRTYQKKNLLKYMYISYTKYILFVVVISQPHVRPRLLIFSFCKRAVLLLY